MRRISALLLVSAAGCSGFVPPTPGQLQALGFQAEAAGSGRVTSRYRIQMSVDSPWLAGEFEGAVLARHGGGAPVIRMQLFGDLGPKILELSARPGRIVGYFPQTREAVDCALPAEAAPHPLILLGASLVERFSAVNAERVLGLREEADGAWIRLRPAIEGMETRVFRDRAGRMETRRLSWMYGLSWEEQWRGEEEVRIAAPDLSIRVKILERESKPGGDTGSPDLVLPGDVHVVKGSRK